MKKHRFEIQGPKFVWKAKPKKSLSRKMEMYRAIVTEKEAKENLEKIYQENNLKPIAFLEQGLAVSTSIAHITLTDGGMATGFLIAPDVLLTNHHVFRNKNDAQSATVRFNYQTDLFGNFLVTDEYSCDPESLFKNNDELDYAVVRMKDEPGMKWGFLKVKPIDVIVEAKVNIIQHPAGGPKHIAMNDNEVKYVDGSFIQYITDTMPGSSGSPVFNDDWQVIGLHHSGGYIPEPSTNSIHFRNEGIRINAILQDMPAL